MSEIYNTLVDCDMIEVNNSIVTDSMLTSTLPEPIVNAGTMSKEAVTKATTANKKTLDKNDYIAPRCECCGLTNRQIHLLIKQHHTGKADNCFLRGPDFLKDPHLKETVKQYNVKAKHIKKPPPPPNAAHLEIV